MTAMQTRWSRSRRHMSTVTVVSTMSTVAATVTAMTAMTSVSICVIVNGDSIPVYPTQLQAQIVIFAFEGKILRFEFSNAHMRRRHCRNLFRSQMQGRLELRDGLLELQGRSIIVSITMD